MKDIIFTWSSKNVYIWLDYTIEVTLSILLKRKKCDKFSSFFLIVAINLEEEFA